MHRHEQKMTPAQMACLVDAALKAPHAVTFLDSAVATFHMLGRHSDGATTAWIGCLLAEGEMEALMSLRAAWRRGEGRAPAEVTRRVMRCWP